MSRGKDTLKAGVPWPAPSTPRAPVSVAGVWGLGEAAQCLVVPAQPRRPAQQACYWPWAWAVKPTHTSATNQLSSGLSGWDGKWLSRESRGKELETTT